MVYLSVGLALVAIIVAAYYYFTREPNIFKEHGVPYQQPLPILGNMGKLKYKSMQDIIFDSYNQHPEAKYVGFFDFQYPVVLLRDPELIKSVTIKNFEHFPDHRGFVTEKTDPMLGKMLFSLRGDQWKEDRVILSPTFTTSKIKCMFNQMTVCASRFSEMLSKLPEKENEIDFRQSMQVYTNDVIANCVYSINVDTTKEPKNVFYVYGRLATMWTTTRKWLTLMLLRASPRLAELLNLSLVDKHISQFFMDLATDAVKNREQTGSHYPDMLQLMMDSRNKKDDEKGLSREGVAIHAFSFFFAGFDSIATQTSFVFRLLAEHPDVQTKLQDEIDEALSATDGKLDYEAIKNMRYLDAVINEVLRLYPIAVFLDRLCQKSFELPPAVPGAKPLTVKPGMNLWVPTAAIHLDSNYYENPKKFDPERFMENGKAILNSGWYMPFGLGPRMCIGNRFALMEMKVLICHLLARCNLKLGPKAVVPLQMEPSVLAALAKGGFWLKVEPKKHLHPTLRVNGTVNGVANGVANGMANGVANGVANGACKR